MPPPLKGGGIKQCFCLTSVAHFGSRTEKLRRTKIGTEVAHVTRDSNCTFRVKGQGHQAALLTTVLRLRQLQQSAWERTDMFWSARWREALQRPLREERGGAYCVAMCTACYITFFFVLPLIQRVTDVHKATLLTIDRRSGDSRPDGHGDVDNDEPERHQRHEVVELIGTIHHQTQDHHEEVEPHQHLTTTNTQYLAHMTKKPLEGTLLYKKPLEGTLLYKKALDGTLLYKKPLERTLFYKKPLERTLLYKKPREGTLLYTKSPEETSLYTKPLEGTSLYKKPLEGTSLYKKPLGLCCIRRSPLKRLRCTRSTLKGLHCMLDRLGWMQSDTSTDQKS